MFPGVPRTDPVYDPLRNEPRFKRENDSSRKTGGKDFSLAVNDKIINLKQAFGCLGIVFDSS